MNPSTTAIIGLFVLAISASSKGKQLLAGTFLVLVLLLSGYLMQHSTTNWRELTTFIQSWSTETWGTIAVFLLMAIGVKASIQLNRGEGPLAAFIQEIEEWFEERQKPKRTQIWLETYLEKTPQEEIEIAYDKTSDKIKIIHNQEKTILGQNILRKATICEENPERLEAIIAKSKTLQQYFNQKAEKSNNPH